MEARSAKSLQDSLPSETSEGPLQLLVETVQLLARERSLDVILQAALDAGLKLCGASFGVFVASSLFAEGGADPLYKVSGMPMLESAKLLQLRQMNISFGTLEGRGTVRSGDVLEDPRYGKTASLFEVFPAPQPIRSLLAVPVRSRDGESLGAMLYGHPETDRFSQESESLVAAVAAQAAVAMDNALLAAALAREIAQADAAREQQRHAAEQLSSVFEATSDAVFLLDREWRFTFLNRRAITLIAQGRNLLGQNIWESFPESMGTAFQKRSSSVMDGKGLTEFTEFFTPLDSWFHVRAYPTAECVTVFFQDVTEAHNLKKERAETDRRLRQALDAGELGTWTWDKDTDLADLDERAAKILGGEAHVPVKRSDLRSRIIVQDDLPASPANLRDVLERGGTYQTEYRVEVGDGLQRWVSTRGMPTYLEGTRELQGMIGTVQDITPRKLQEATLRQSEKLAATGRLAATIAHEINNPLEAVTNLIYLSKTDPTVPVPIQRLLETADSELARVAQIAQQTLGFYRDTSRPVNINLTELLSGVADLFSRKLGSRNLKFELDLDENLHIHGLQGEMRQVFSNLVVNAIDASLKGTIRVRARPRVWRGAEGVSVIISDEGSGIPPGVREHLFTPFFTTKESIGTGLGLWVTRGIVEKAGGSVAFRSRVEPPSGTCFRVNLPAGNRGTGYFSAPNSMVLQ